MTFDDDYIRLVFDHGVKNVSCKAVGIEWPPPLTLDVGGFIMVRSRYSSLTDEQREGMTHICRGAEYLLAKEQDFSQETA